MLVYATIEDLIARFGETEIIRLTVPEGQPMTGVCAGPAETALSEATAQIDTYLRKRYRTPLDVPPPEVVRVCCILARYDLSFGGGRDVPEQTRLARKDAIAWLENIAKGLVELDLEEVAPGDDSYAQASVRGHDLACTPAWDL